MINEKEYFPIVEKFLKELNNLDVQSVCLIALTNSAEKPNLSMGWNCGAYETLVMSSLLQLYGIENHIEDTYDVKRYDEQSDNSEEVEN